MRCHRIIWKIENFIAMKSGTIKSVPFGISWRITITSFASSEYINIDVKELLFSFNAYSNFTLTLLDSEGSPLLWRETKNIPKSRIVQFHDIKRDTVFGSMRDTSLPNDTLIVQILIWNTPEQLLNPLSFFVCSGIEHQEEVIKKSFSWNIANALATDQTGTQVELFTSEGDAQLSTSRGVVLMIRLFLDMSLSVKLSGVLDAFQEVKCIISVSDIKGKVIQVADEQYNFQKKNEVWSFDKLIAKDLLEIFRNEFLPNGTLTLVFVFTFITKRISHRILEREGEIFVKNSQPNVALPLTSAPSTSSDEPANKKKKLSNNTISRALMDILEEGFMSDFSFRVQDKTFPVHKAILGARSSVFRAMFTVDMKEKESNSVNIPDVDADTFQRMLNFIYSDSFEEDMQWESVSKLYSVADMYDLEPLKQKCSQQLKSGLCVTSVLEVLLLGDKHRDDDLKAAAVDFIAKDSKKFIASDRWRRFAEENLQLAFDTLQIVFVKKIDV